MYPAPPRKEESEADYEHRVHQTIDNYINRNSIIQTLILTERVTLARVQILPLGRYHMPRHQTDVHAQAWGQPTRPIDGRTILFPRGLIAPDTGPLSGTVYSPKINAMDPLNVFA